MSRRVKDAAGTCEVLDVGMRTDSLKVKGMTERSSATPLLASWRKKFPSPRGKGELRGLLCSVVCGVVRKCGALRTCHCNLVNRLFAFVVA